jgi:hypothetical protein
MVVNKVPAKARRCGDFGSVTVSNIDGIDSARDLVFSPRNQLEGTGGVFQSMEVFWKTRTQE